MREKLFERFREAYLPDQQVDATVDSKTEIEGYHEVEDGWLGYRIAEKVLALVFSCPDRESARIIHKWHSIERYYRRNDHEEQKKNTHEKRFHQGQCLCNSQCLSDWHELGE